MIQVAITTVDRPGSYILGTLERLFRSAAGLPRVRVVVDGANAAFLGKWNEDSRVKVELLTSSEALNQENVPPIDRCVYTTYRAFEQHVGRGDDAPLILLQDDVDFASGWLEKTVHTALYVEADTGSDNFVLALYCPYKYERKPYSVYVRKDFYGNQGLYLTAKATRAMRDVLLGSVAARWKDGVLRNDPDDLLMRNSFVARREPYLLAMVPSVVQHIGKQSTGVAGAFHESPMFGG